MQRHPLPQPRPGQIRVAPSLLAADFARLGEEVARVEQAGADVLHIDVMDGHFVPNLTIGPPLVESLRRVTSLPFDVHLMLTNPERFIKPFADAGADHITIHAEIAADVRQVLNDIRGLGCSCGLSLRPRTPAADLLPFLDAVDLILVMTVEPGFGGQAFMADMLPKLCEFRKAIDAAGRPVHLEVDGGIGPDTVGRAVGAGADLLVAGNSVFRAKDGVAAAMARLRQTRAG